jgi:hypothetical protein
MAPAEGNAMTATPSEAPNAMTGAPSAMTPAAPEPAEAVAPAPPPPPPVLPAGTAITVITGQALGSKTSQTGQEFRASVAKSISAAGKVLVPRSSSVRGTVVNAKAKGKIKGQGELSLTLNSLTVNGKTYTISTNTSNQVIKGKGKRTGVATGAGGGAGALIGGIAGGGKGALIGAGVGAGAGFATGTFTGNSQIELPAETSLTFTLQHSVTLR